MYREGGSKLHRRLRDHPTEDSKVSRSLQSGGSSSSTAPAPAHAPDAPEPPMPPPSSPPGDLHVFEGAKEDDFSSVVTMLVGHGVQPIDAQRFVTSLVKGESGNEDATGFVELYGQGGLSKAAKRFKGLNVRGLEVLDLRSARPDGESWDFTRQSDRLRALRLLREQQPMWVIAAPPCTA